MVRKIVLSGIAAVALAAVLALTPVFAQDKVYINGFDADYPPFSFVFRTTGSVVPMIEGTIGTFESIKAKKGFDKAFIMVQDVAHDRAAGNALKEGLEKRGWSIIGFEIYPTGSTDFSVGLSKAKDGKAQYLIPWFDMPEVSILMKQWYDMKVPALPIGYIHALQDEGTWKATDGKVANAVVLYAKAGSVATKAIPMSEVFVSGHKKKYGIEPRSEWTSTSYTVVYILKDAIERAKSLAPDAIIPALEKTDMMGTYGRVKFDPKNHQIIENGDPKETAVGMCGDRERVRAERLAITLSRAVVPPQLSMEDAAGLIGHAAAVIGVDTGLMHLAAALSVPVVGIYCDSEPLELRPLGAGPTAYRGGIGKPTTVAAVLDALHEVAPAVA